MELSAGTRLGPYEIVDSLGAGGNYQNADLGAQVIATGDGNTLYHGGSEHK